MRTADEAAAAYPLVFALSAAMLAGLLILALAGRAGAQTGGVEISGRSFNTWQDYYYSDFFIQGGKRCGKPPTVPFQGRAVDPSDCTYSVTNPSSDYDTVDVYEIPVVVHIIEHTNGDGQISDALVHSQIDILNEDFLALAGTPGAPGFDTGIQFVLASLDPQGMPTTGITRDVNNTWFNDGGAYYNTLAWDTSRYMNIYTNSAGGNLGYVPDLPQGGIAGSNQDRVVVLWSAFGRDSPGGPPYDQGRTATHEVGHYLGLEHTFNGGCASGSPPSCYSSGDLICDTNSESSETYGCPGGQSSCGSPDPVDNYMNYTDDPCMMMFTDEQSHRMRCSLLNYRPDLYTIVNPAVCGNDVTESGEDCDGIDDSSCPGLCQLDCMCPPPVCGNDIIELGEECDGTDPGACPTGVCDPDCTCEDPVCGNDVAEAGEDCDGTDDASCPGECDSGCLCPIVCLSELLWNIRARSDSQAFKLRGNLDNSSSAFDGLDPRGGFTFVVSQGPSSVQLTIPSFDGGWDSSKPSKGKYRWKGDLGGFTSVRAFDRSDNALGAWKVVVKGRDVPGAGNIDVLATFDIQTVIDGACNQYSY